MMKFEHFPNELLLEIFEYIEIRDLFYGFFNLNQRFNQLIQSINNFSLTLEHDQPELVASFSKQIKRVVVPTCQDINLKQFPYIHSLILYHLTNNQLQQIRSKFMPNLTYISILSKLDVCLVPEFIEQIFSNEIPTIRHLNLNFINIPKSISWSQVFSLRSISIQCKTPTIIPLILFSSPNLIYFRAEFLIDTVSILYRLSGTIEDHPLKEFYLSDPYHNLSFNLVYTLLTFIPNVQKLYLNILLKIPFIRFAKNLLNRLKHLERFKCHIDDASSDKLTDTETIRQIHPCFSRIQCPLSDFHFRTFILD